MFDNLAVIIVNYQSEEDIKELYSKISGVGDIIVVDNSSSNDLSEWCSNTGVDYIDFGENLGYSGGNNVGIRHSLRRGGNEHILILNPDIDINEEDIVKLQSSREGSDYSIISPVIVNGDDVPVNQFPTPEGDLFRWVGLLPALPNRGSNIKPVDHAHGSCMLISNSVFEQIGYLNESFFMYYEEIEFCYRARRENIKIGQCQNVNVTHNQPVIQTRFESSNQVYLDFRNRFLASNTIFTETGDRARYHLLTVLISGWMLIRMVSEKKFEYVLPAILGALHGVQKKSGKPDQIS